MAMIEINWSPSRRELKQFAGIWFPGLFALVGALVAYHTQSLAVGACIWVPGLLLGLIGFLFPRLARPVFVGWMCVAYPIGWIVSHVLLAAVFFLVITPIGLAFRVLGRDPLRRKFDRSASTYWIPHSASRDSRRYFRQF